MLTDRLRCRIDQISQYFSADERYWPAVRFEETNSNGIKGEDIYTLSKARLTADEAF